MLWQHKGSRVLTLDIYGILARNGYYLEHTEDLIEQLYDDYDPELDPTPMLADLVLSNRGYPLVEKALSRTMDKGKLVILATSLVRVEKWSRYKAKFDEKIKD